MPPLRVSGENRRRMKAYYSGVGSRKALGNIDVEVAIKKAAIRLADLGFILRSGGAVGPDTWFEEATIGTSMEKDMEIYLPKKEMFGHPSPLYTVCDDAMRLASTIHRRWDDSNDLIRKLHARNCYQVLGQDLKTPSDFVVCYTPGGRPIGGTRTAIKLAEQNDIPVFNFGKYSPEKYDDAFELFLLRNSA